ncbi:hypothetical protein V8C44DRAFT_62001 [Trichoderma aethiopicum]
MMSRMKLHTLARLKLVRCQPHSEARKGRRDQLVEEVLISFSGHFECSRVQLLVRSQELCMEGKGGERIHEARHVIFLMSSYAHFGLLRCRHFALQAEQKWEIRIFSMPSLEQPQFRRRLLERGIKLYSLLVLPYIRVPYLFPTKRQSADAKTDQNRQPAKDMCLCVYHPSIHTSNIQRCTLYVYGCDQFMGPRRGGGIIHHPSRPLTSIPFPRNRLPR